MLWSNDLANRYGATMDVPAVLHCQRADHARVRLEQSHLGILGVQGPSSIANKLHRKSH